MKIDFSEVVKINKYRLEVECERHPGNYHYYADLLAKANSDLNDAKDKLELITSEVDLELRRNWNEKKYGKQTENAITGLIITNVKIINQKEVLRIIQRNVNILSAGVKALEHKKSSLDNLVTLYTKGFYASPGGKREDINDQSSRELRNNLKKGNGGKR